MTERKACRFSLTGLAFLAIFLAIFLSEGLWDPDYFWHLATGEYIVTHGEIPRADIFSFSQPGKPWVAHEWLFQVVIHLIHVGMGDLGIKLFVAATGTLALYLGFSSARLVAPKGWGPLLIVLAVLFPFLSGLTPRPQLFSFVFFAAYLHVLLGLKYAGWSKWSLLWLPPLMAIWANVHGGYVVGLVLIVLFFLAEAAMAWWRGMNAGTRHYLGGLALAFLASLLASAVNPDHFKHWLYPFEVMRMEAAQSMISEWVSPNFHGTMMKLYLALVLAYFVLSAWRKRQPDIVEMAIPAFFFTASLVSVRHVPLVLLVLIPFLTLAWVNVRDEAMQGVRRLMPRGWSLSGGREMGRSECVLNALLGLLMVGLAVLYYPLSQEGWKERRAALAPFDAVEFIEMAGLKGRIFSTYHYGGLLIHRLYPDQKVFIDGRADMYGDEFIKEHRRIYSAQRGWEESFDRWGFDIVLTGLDAPIRQVLLARGDFESVYEDQYNSVLVRRGKFSGSLP